MVLLAKAMSMNEVSRLLGEHDTTIRAGGRIAKMGYTLSDRRRHSRFKVNASKGGVWSSECPKSTIQTQKSCFPFMVSSFSVFGDRVHIDVHCVYAVIRSLSHNRSTKCFLIDANSEVANIL